MNSDDNSQITFQLSIPSYATMSSDLFNIARKFKLVMSYSSNSYSTMKKRSSSNVKRYVDDEENWCGTGLVAFDYSLVNHSMVDYELQQTTTGDDDNGDAVERGRKSFALPCCLFSLVLSPFLFPSLYLSFSLSLSS